MMSLTDWGLPAIMGAELNPRGLRFKIFEPAL